MDRLILEKLEKIENGLSDIKVSMQKSESNISFHEEKIKILETKVSALEKGKLKTLYWILSAIGTGAIAVELKRILLP